MAIWGTLTENRPIFGVISIPNWPSQQAYLSNEEEYPNEHTIAKAQNKTQCFWKCLIKVNFIPAGNKENNCTSSWTTWIQRLPTAEAPTCYHYNDLANHEEQKCANTITSCYVWIIDTVIVIYFRILFNYRLQHKISLIN